MRRREMEMGMEEGSLRLSATRTARKRHSATVLKRKLAGRFGGSPDYVWDTGEVPRSRALSLKCRLQRQARTPLAHPSGRFVHPNALFAARGVAPVRRLGSENCSVVMLRHRPAAHLRRCWPTSDHLRRMRLPPTADGCGKAGSRTRLEKCVADQSRGIEPLTP
jgi:hypothetical protein